MTNPTADLGAILTSTRYLLLDFDGPICSIFAGLPSSSVTDQLRKHFVGQQAPVPDDVARIADPLEVFAYAATVSLTLAAEVEAEMTELEITAAASARPTPPRPGGSRRMPRIRQDGRRRQQQLRPGSPRLPRPS